MTKETEWLDEPNKLEWEHEGYKCVIIRNSKYGHLCGYVQLGDSHPWHGKNKKDKEIADIDVHGGITYGGHHLLITNSKSISHVWWLGFDAGHNGLDNFPFIGCDNGTYKNIAFMKAECEKLVRQCKEAFEKNLLEESNLNGKRVKNIEIDNKMTWYLNINFDGDDSTHYYRCSDSLKNFQERFDDSWEDIYDDKKENFLMALFKKHFVHPQQKPYTCDCTFYRETDNIISINMCHDKDPENIRLCKLATTIWYRLLNAFGTRRAIFTQSLNDSSELRAIVFKVLADESTNLD